MISIPSSISFSVTFNGGLKRIDRSPLGRMINPLSRHFVLIFVRSSGVATSNAAKRPSPRGLVTTSGAPSTNSVSPATRCSPTTRAFSDEVLFLDDLQIPLGPHHVHQVSAPGGIQPARDRKDVVLHLFDPSSAEEPAHLHLLPERDHVRLDEVLVRPHLPRHADAGLDLVDDQHRLVLVGQLPERPEELAAEMVVASFSLDRLDDDRRNVVLVVAERLLDLVDGQSPRPA